MAHKGRVVIFRPLASAYVALAKGLVPLVLWPSVTPDPSHCKFMTQRAAKGAPLSPLGQMKEAFRMQGDERSPRNSHHDNHDSVMSDFIGFSLGLLALFVRVPR